MEVLYVHSVNTTWFLQVFWTSTCMEFQWWEQTSVVSMEIQPRTFACDGCSWVHSIPSPGTTTLMMALWVLVGKRGETVCEQKESENIYYLLHSPLSYSVQPKWPKIRTQTRPSRHHSTGQALLWSFGQVILLNQTYMFLPTSDIHFIQHKDVECKWTPFFFHPLTGPGSSSLG